MAARFDVLISLGPDEQRKLEQITTYFERISPFPNLKLSPDTVFGIMLELTHLRMNKVEILELLTGVHGKETRA
jgi:hypothetical protein